MILVAGSANLDFVVQVPHTPTPGETVLGRELAFFPGGKGANQAIACTRAGGAKTEMLLAFGDDGFAKPIEDSLSGASVRMHRLRVPDKRNGTAFITVSDDAAALACTRLGAQSSISDREQLESFLNNDSAPDATKTNELRNFCGFQ